MARPRSFEPDDALDALMALFWAKGYEGTSMLAVERATAQKKQGLYRLFGDKRGMYLRALERYDAQVIGAALRHLEGDAPPRERFRALWSATLADAFATGDRRGCFLCNASTDQAAQDPTVAALVQRMIARLQAAYEDALAADPRWRDDPEGRRAQALALLAAYFGMRVMIRAGLPRAALDTQAEATLAVLD